MNIPSKKGLRAVLAMSQADCPTRGEFIAAWNDGLIDLTLQGMLAIRNLKLSPVLITEKGKKVVSGACALPILPELFPHLRHVGQQLLWAGVVILGLIVLDLYLKARNRY